MILIRRSEERGFEDKGWLQTFHTFSFDTYFDPKFMSFHTLRVLNEDTVKGGKGFGLHTHKDMEIVTYVIEGALEHKDSMGHTTMLSEGQVQRISAGKGISHSEYNLSHQVPVHFIQIWIMPQEAGLEPSYQQKAFQSAAKSGQWCLLVSRNGRGGSIVIHQDADIYATILDDHDEISFEALTDRHYWIQVISGRFLLGEVALKQGDGAALTEEDSIHIECLEGGELLLLDLG